MLYVCAFATRFGEKITRLRVIKGGGMKLLNSRLATRQPARRHRDTVAGGNIRVMVY